MIIERVNEVMSMSQSEISMDDGFTFNQHETIRRINYYINSRFLERNDNAIFWNLSTSRITHFAKNIDLDTKDLQPYGIGDVAFVKVWILKMKFHKWLEENKFAITLNDLAESCAAYGSTIWKVVQDDDDGSKTLQECNLRSVYFDPTTENIRETDIVELHQLSAMELKERSNIWTNVDKVLETKANEESKKYEIWEFWGQFEDDKGEVVYGHYIGYGYGKDFVQLFEDLEVEDDDMPYYDFHIGRYFGRWMRLGIVERLFKLQERVNQLVNQNAQASEIASLLLLRTANGDNLGNVLTDLENGQVIQSDDMQQIGLSNTGMSQFINEMQVIERQADQICLTPSVIQGESSPSGTAFRAVALISNSAKAAFSFIKQRIGETIGYILLEEIFPDVVKNWNAGDILEIAGDEADVKIYDQFLRKAVKWETYINQVLDGKLTTQDTLDAIDQQITGNVETVGRRIEIPKNFFDFDYSIRLNVTGEEVDKAQKNDAMFNAIQLVSQNPAVMNIPLFKQYLEDNGINWWRMSPEEQQQVAQGAQQMAGATPQAPVQQNQLASLANTNTR